MNITIKKSHPSEVAIAVPLIYSSGPDAFEFVFKNNKVAANDFLSYAFVKNGGEFSFDNHYSLYLNDKMVGIGSVFDGQKAKSFSMKDALNIIQFYKFGCFSVLKNGLQTEAIIKLPTKNEIAIAHLGIAPEYRGKGLGTQLIHALMKETNKTAESRFVLDVSEENPKAKLLYERLGFKTTKRNNSSLKNKFSYVPNHFRMELIR